MFDFRGKLSTFFLPFSPYVNVGVREGVAVLLDLLDYRLPPVPVGLQPDAHILRVRSFTMVIMVIIVITMVIMVIIVIKQRHPTPWTLKRSSMTMFPRTIAKFNWPKMFTFPSCLHYSTLSNQTFCSGLNQRGYLVDLSRACGIREKLPPFWSEERTTTLRLPFGGEKSG